MESRTLQPIRVCVVRWISWRFYRVVVPSEKLWNPGTGVHGCVFAGGGRGLRDRPDWLFAFWRWRLWSSDKLAVGHELPARASAHYWPLGPRKPQRCLSQIRIARELHRSSHSNLRIPDLVV